MEITPMEQIELSNLKEHLKVLRGNIRIASEELSSLYKEIKTLKILLTQIKKDRDIVRENTNKMNIEANERKLSLDKKEESILERESKQKEVDKELTIKQAKAEQELKNILEKISKLKLEYNKEVDSSNKKINELKSIISILDVEQKQNEKTIKNQLGIKAKQENEISRLDSQIKEAQKELDKFHDEAYKEKKKIILEIEMEKEKIKNPIELLRIETEKLERLKTDLDIIKSRLTKQFKKQNPDIILPLELQNNKI